MSMTKQEIFNKATRHLLTQKEKALDPNGNCAYLDPTTGKRCAVGALIPDGHPARCSTVNVTTLVRLFPDLEELWGGEGSTRLLSYLQRIHDDSDPKEWAGDLKALANNHQLDPSVLKEFDDE